MRPDARGPPRRFPTIPIGKVIFGDDGRHGRPGCQPVAPRRLRRLREASPGAGTLPAGDGYRAGDSGAVARPVRRPSDHRGGEVGQLGPAQGLPFHQGGGAGHAWTGRELLVWGGGTTGSHLADGAIYDPAADTWKPMARSPLAARGGHVVAWTGQEMLVWGGGADRPYGDAAAYRPGANTWEPLPQAPLTPRAGAFSAWTGQELVVWGGNAPSAGSSRAPLGDGARLRP